MAQNVTKYFGYFCIKICRQELLKTAQSRHTVVDLMDPLKQEIQSKNVIELLSEQKTNIFQFNLFWTEIRKHTLA